jgi:hypothetical protein
MPLCCVPSRANHLTWHSRRALGSNPWRLTGAAATLSSSNVQFFPAGAHGEVGGRVNHHYVQDPGVKFCPHLSDQFGPFHTRERINLTSDYHRGRSPTLGPDGCPPLRTHALTSLRLLSCGEPRSYIVWPKNVRFCGSLIENRGPIGTGVR